MKFSNRGTARIRIPAIRATSGCNTSRLTVMGKLLDAGRVGRAPATEPAPAAIVSEPAPADCAIRISSGSGQWNEVRRYCPEGENNHDHVEKCGMDHGSFLTRFGSPRREFRLLKGQRPG